MGQYRPREESDYVTFAYIVHRTARRVEGCLFDVEVALGLSTDPQDASLFR
jgi:hypothetical protein